MNRRHFFGMTAAALIGAGLPLSLLPERSIFLPPRGGWYPSDLRMREVIQYSVLDDKLFVRHDALFANADVESCLGFAQVNLEQVHVVQAMPHDEANECVVWAEYSTTHGNFGSREMGVAVPVKFNPEHIDRIRTLSRLRLEQFSRIEGLTVPRGCRLPLPQGTFARYV